MEWQTIETAPKNGVGIIVADAQGYVGEVFWMDSWYGDKTKPGWLIANCDEEYGCYINATHWMPLPPPPESKE